MWPSHKFVNNIYCIYCLALRQKKILNKRQMDTGKSAESDISLVFITCCYSIMSWLCYISLANKTVNCFYWCISCVTTYTNHITRGHSVQSFSFKLPTSIYTVASIKQCVVITPGTNKLALKAASNQYGSRQWNCCRWIS